MKKLIALICFLILFFEIGYAQRFLGSAMAGVNVTQVDGDQVYGYRKAGVHVGAAVSLPLDNKQRWLATLELLYTQKGSYRKYYVSNMCDSCPPDINIDKTIPCNSKIKYKLQLDYVEIPITVHYEDPRTGWSIGAGMAWGRLVNAKEIENGWTRTTSIRSKTYKNNEWSVLADVKIRIWKGLKINFRYQYTFVPIRERDFYVGTPIELRRKQYNNVLTCRIIYVFNEKFEKNAKGKWEKPPLK